MILEVLDSMIVLLTVEPDLACRRMAQQAVAALALEFVILTAARTGKAIAAEWDEVDLAKALWTVTPEGDDSEGIAPLAHFHAG